MAEVGLIPFARVALQVATTVLPPYRTRFSKHQFTQPQLLAVLGLTSVPDSTTLYRFLKRLQPDTIDRALGEVGEPEGEKAAAKRDSSLRSE